MTGVYSFLFFTIVEKNSIIRSPFIDILFPEQMKAVTIS